MIFTEEIIRRRLNLYVHDDFDWFQLFDDHEHPNEIPIVLSQDNMDFFYPNWRTKYDPENLPETLDEFVAGRFDIIRVTIADGVSFKDGEGEYEVSAFAIAFPLAENDEKFDITAEGKVLAKLFYQVSSAHYEA